VGDSLLVYLLIFGFLLYIARQIYLGARVGLMSPAHSPPLGQRTQELPNRFVVFDLETTGLYSDRHQIIEIGAIRFNSASTKHDTLCALIKIDGKLPARITEITGITKAMLDSEGEAIEAALPQFLDFIGDLRLVSFNAEFDIGFLKAAAKKQGRAVRNPVSCALKMSRRTWPGRSSYKLESLALDAGLSQQKHRALGDCELALQIYVAAAKQLGRIS
jgi:DNA polymerase III epsilon subunit family exonuclease